jgi:hypothetical protein
MEQRASSFAPFEMLRAREDKGSREPVTRIQYPVTMNR